MVLNKKEFTILLNPKVKKKVETLYREYKGINETKSFSIWIETLLCYGIREFELTKPEDK